MKRVFKMLLFAVLTIPSAISHDASKHKGKAVEGVIKAVSVDKIEIKIAAGSITVALTTTTKIEHGTELVDRSHLKAGERVAVFGTKLASGELVAREIVIAASPGDHTAGDHAKTGNAKKTKELTRPATKKTVSSKAQQ